MKITKRQLRRIIKEERAKLLKEAPRYGDGNVGGDYSTGRWDGLEEKFETVLYEMQEMFVQVNGVSHQEAGEMIMDEVEKVIGIVR